MDKVSIVIPNFNKSKYIEETLLSAINQTYENIEIICVDDRSTDTSVEIIDQYSKEDKRFKYFINEQNMGISKTLNRAISLSSGKYISWLSSDDVYSLDKIEKNILHIKDCDFLYSDYYNIDERSILLNMYKIGECDVPKELHYNHFINGCSCLFSRKAYDYIGGFDEELGGKSGYCADTFLWHKISYIFRYTYLPIPLVYYRNCPEQGQNNIQNEFKIQTKREYHRRIHEWLKEQGLEK